MAKGHEIPIFVRIAHLPRMAIHTATGEASRVYSISLFTFHNGLNFGCVNVSRNLSNTQSPNNPLADDVASFDW